MRSSQITPNSYGKELVNPRLHSLMVNSPSVASTNRTLISSTGYNLQFLRESANYNPWRLTLKRNFRYFLRVIRDEKISAQK